MNGVVMGGGMGIAQSGVASRLRIVTEAYQDGDARSEYRFIS